MDDKTPNQYKESDQVSFVLEIPETITPELAEKIDLLDRLMCQIAPLEPVSSSPRVQSAFKYVQEMAKEAADFSLSSIKRLHELIGLEGKLRGSIEAFWSENNIAIDDYHPALAEDLEKILTAYINKYHPKQPAEHPLLRIAGAYLTFELIHPFRDGNGRVGRLIVARLMYAYGYGDLAPYLEGWMGDNNVKHGSLFKSQIHSYLAWCNPSFRDYFLFYVNHFFYAFLVELIDICQNIVGRKISVQKNAVI